MVRRDMNPTTEVRLRRRSTPYDFEVTMICGGRSLGIYKGTSYQYAVNAYWQAVRTLQFLGSSGKIRIGLLNGKQPFGAFATEVERGRAISLHTASGKCIEWFNKGWIGEDIAEKVIATVPGTLGPARGQIPAR